MFLMLDDGRDINLSKVTIVEAFNAEAYVAETHNNIALSHFAKEAIERLKDFNARVFMSDYQPAENRRRIDDKGWTLIEETPAEFKAKANLLLRSGLR